MKIQTPSLLAALAMATFVAAAGAMVRLNPVSELGGAVVTSVPVQSTKQPSKGLTQRSPMLELGDFSAPLLHQTSPSAHTEQRRSMSGATEPANSHILHQTSPSAHAEPVEVSAHAEQRRSMSGATALASWTDQTLRRVSKGEEIYLLTCHACHETGAQGAPRLGNQEEWKERLRKGRKTLLKHSLEGFGAMPPKGGHTTLTKKQVALALNFMLAKLR